MTETKQTYTAEDYKRDLDAMVLKLPEDVRRHGDIVSDALYNDGELLSRAVAFNLIAMNNQLQAIQSLLTKHAEAFNRLFELERMKVLANVNQS